MSNDQGEMMKSAEDKSRYADVQEDVEVLKADISKLISLVSDTINDVVGAAQHQARRRYHQARSGVDTVMTDVEKQSSAALDMAQDSLATIEDTLEDAVQRRPLATVGLAVGLGFLIGVTWRR